MKKAVAALLITLFVGTSVPVFAHSGGTDSQGCHTKHSDGSYHCHNKK